MAVPTELVLEWLSEVMAQHRSRSGTALSTSLVPAALPERDRWIDLLRQALEAEDGALIDARVSGHGVECGALDDASELVDSVAAFLDGYNQLDPDAKLRLSIDGGQATILGTNDYESANAAQKAVREVAAAVCDAELRSTELTALIYADEAFDETIADLVWGFLMQLPETLSLSTRSTVNVIAGDTNIFYAVHCSGPRSLRYRIDSVKLRRRHPWERAVAPIKNMARYSRDDMPLLTVFLGAGASADDGLPIGDSLRNEALQRIMRTPVSWDTFPDVARAWFERLSVEGQLPEVERLAGVDEFVRALTLERVLEYEQHEENTNLCTTLRSFRDLHAVVFDKVVERRESGELDDDPVVRLCAARQRLVLVTVNFDRLLEARAPDDIEPFYTPEQLALFPEYLSDYKANGGKVPLLKLHGDIGDASTLVANIAETTAGLTSPRETAISALIEDMSRSEYKPWWYVGYSMRDRDLDGVWKKPAITEFVEHWVSPFLDPSVEEFINTVRLRRWQERNRAYTAMERLVSLTARDFLGVLTDEVASTW